MRTEAEIIESAITAIEGVLTLHTLEQHQRDLIHACSGSSPKHAASTRPATAQRAR